MVHFEPDIKSAVLEQPPFHMMLDGALRGGKTLEPITITFKTNEGEVYCEVPKGFRTDFSSLPSRPLAIIMTLVLAFPSWSSDPNTFWLALLILFLLAYLPRGAMFPAGVVHDAFYRNRIVWYRQDPKTKRKANTTLTPPSRAWVDALYRHMIISYSSQAGGLIGKVSLPVRWLGAWTYWLALRLFGWMAYN